MTDDYGFSQCRAMGHAWRHRGRIATGTHGYNAPMGWFAVGFMSQCGACKTTRVKWITRSGETANRYYPPEGYSLRGDDSPTMRQWRQHWVASTFAEFDNTTAEGNTA